MSKKTFRFGDEYLLAYGRAIFKIKRHRTKAPTMRINARKHRDAQQWAYVVREDND